ncbi:class I SAM-dependent methyltransferase [Companilactobacillus sp. HBUAS59544]|uniref:class I SAM-dependent methyltransferase n=1 Tax=Companilactobacillus sp. HBUAS59544 TaxID=3109363 RepID=UPI002FF34955
MEENEYDNSDFFKAYSKFPRSVKGLKAAGEWPTFQKMLPDFKNKRVLDVGCGFGWHDLYAAQHQAKSVLGIDISENMLQVAQEKNHYDNVHYQKMAMEEIDFPQNSFDVVISSLALHYTPDFNDICQRLKKCLTPNGDFVFSVEHPIFTAFGNQDWFYDENGKITCWPVDHYFAEGERIANFLDHKVVKYHKTLTTYVNTLIQNGFTITELQDPTPPAHLMDVPGMKDEFRRPMMLLISAKLTD